MWKNGLFKIIFVIVCIAIFSTFSFAEVADGHYKYIDNVPYYIPKAGFVPDKVTATRIAETVLISLYGEDVVNEEKPFNAELKDGVWIVQGTFCGGTLEVDSCLGGVATVEISKKTGKILRVALGA